MMLLASTLLLSCGEGEGANNANLSDPPGMDCVPVWWPDYVGCPDGYTRTILWVWFNPAKGVATEEAYASDVDCPDGGWSRACTKYGDAYEVEVRVSSDSNPWDDPTNFDETDINSYTASYHAGADLYTEMLPGYRALFDW